MHLKIGTPADYAPFAFQNHRTDKYLGFEIELIKLITDSLNFTIEFIKTSWYDLDNDLNSNKFDIALGGISLTDNRRQKFLTSIPILEDAKTILTSTKHLEQINKLTDIDKAECTIITNRGGTNERFVNEHIKHANILTVDDNTAIFEQIANGSVDFMITDLSEASYRESIDSRLHVAKPITLYTKPIGYGFIYNRQNSELKDTLDIALKKFIQSKEFKLLYRKYFKI